MPPRFKVLIALCVLLAVPTSSTAAPGVEERYCMAVKPICHLGYAPTCLCATHSITTCAWICAGQP